jgi:biopolymer transport protein ExbB/TolQ
MAEPIGDNGYSGPIYKRGNYFVSALATAVVMLISILVIWQMHSNAVSKIEKMEQQQVQEGSNVAKQDALIKAIRTDPVGFDLAVYMQAHYDQIVLLNYFVLAALCLAAIARFAMFAVSSSRRSQFYPDDKALDDFLRRDFRTWNEFYQFALAQDHRKSRFWRILKDSAMVTNASSRFDHLYLHFRNRIDRITENMSEMTLYDSIATASPAAGFFGTLVGLLYIFGQGQNAAGLSQTPAFAIGMRVAVITSLWGLFNLGLAIAAAYFTRRIVDQIHHQMVVRAVAVCEVVESLKSKEQVDETEPQMIQSKERVRVNA